MITHTTRGCFISLEGLDGAGKSTHVPWLVDQLKARGLPVLCTREPGGTPLGEQLRQMLLETSMHLKTETLLMFAARCEHVHAVILPALEAGQWVVCDRFTDASYAYQGGGRQLGESAVHALEQWAIPGIKPDRTWLFDVPLEVARERLTRSRQLDRFEQEGEAFFQRTRQAYHQRVQQQPQRFHLVDSTLPIEVVRARLTTEIDALVHRHGSNHNSESP